MSNIQQIEQRNSQLEQRNSQLERELTEFKQRNSQLERVFIKKEYSFYYIKFFR